MSILFRAVPYFRGYYQFVGEKTTPAQVIEAIDKRGNHRVLDVCRNMMMKEDVRKMGKLKHVPDITCVFPFKNMLLGIWGHEANGFRKFIDQAYDTPILKPIFAQTSSTHKPDYLILDELDEDTLKDIDYYFADRGLKPESFQHLDLDA